MADIARGIFSWTNFMEDAETTIFATDMDIRFLSFFEPPEIPDSENDIEHIVEERDRLDLLADTHYGEQLLWWVIALRNNFDLPDANLNAGDTIVIPDPDTVLARYVRR